jgi:outer membrane protein OmpA-like peptidoglycan-associated protein
MRRLIPVALVLLIATCAAAQSFRYSLGIAGGPVMMSNGKGYDFNRKMFLGGSIGEKLSDRWALFVDAGYGKLTSSKSPFSTTADSAVDLHALRMVGTLNYRLFSSGRSLHLYLNGGGGFLNWKMIEPHGDTTLKVKGVRSPAVDFQASELVATFGLRFLIQPSKFTSLNLALSEDYLTGAGAVFDQSIKESRGRWLTSAIFSFNLLLGVNHAREKWPSDQAWNATQTAPPRRPGTSALDSDGDGVPDEFDKCPNTQRGAVVDATGCPVDADGDGVPDGLDDCPDTPRSARGFVDVHGCPVDNDFDGVPDYRDSCPSTPVGAVVDSLGCPTDSDGDGVPDGLDDCPNTLKGIPVDKYGCTDVSLFARPMTLNIDYDPGGFEVDPKNKARLEQLARILNLVPDYKLEIDAYTDDIGDAAANQRLSEKRALRVREYLIIYGVAADRIKAVGKGETNFVAPNDKADGRAQNRRLEILFFK